MDVETSFLRGSRSLGLVIEDLRGSEAIAMCPLCGKHRHLYLNTVHGAWKCHKCGESGNYSLLCAHLQEQSQGNFTTNCRKRLADDRGLPTEALDHYDIGELNGTYFIPIRNLNGQLCDVRQYKLGQKSRSTAGCSVGLFGAPRLSEDTLRHSPVYVCEGEGDSIAFEWLRRRVRMPGVVVGVPGANTFKTNWAGWFRGRVVYFCFDNDEPGRSGQARAAQKLAGLAQSCYVLTWPPNTSEKTDIRDLVKGALKRES